MEKLIDINGRNAVTPKEAIKNITDGLKNV